MFNLFKKGSEDNATEETDGFDPDRVTVHYEGEVMSPEYAAETLMRDNFNNQSYPWHNLFPHGQGKLIYKDADGEVLEEYEGNFEAGQYHGQGTLIDRHGEVLEGEFKENKFKG